MIKLIQEKLAAYGPVNQLEEEHAVKEILQEIALYGLWRAGFFERVAFQGGTSLRILHGMARFSEDLDFILKAPDPHFSWTPYLEDMLVCFQEFGLRSEVLEKSRMDERIQRALIKDTSICGQLNLSFYRGERHRQQKIKLEIDIDPPGGSGFEYSYLDFPLDFEVCHQDLASNFSLKIHAVLCRPYLKGRDWYDFAWYMRHNIQPNPGHLWAALEQRGPWQGQDVVFDFEWLRHALAEKIAVINWKEAAADVERFLAPAEQKSLALWSERFFMDKIQRLGSDRPGMT